MSTNQFEVLGIDVRDYGRFWLAGWKDFLFGDDSPIKKMLDSAVELHHADGALDYFQGGAKIAAIPGCARVIGLPADKVLQRKLQLPAAVETDLDMALSMEVSASSPFSPDDTVAGWYVTRESEGDVLQIDLVVASRRAVENFLADTHSIYESAKAEVWAPSGDRWVVVNGFGEAVRSLDYKRRLLLAGSFVTGALVLLICLAGLSTGLAQAKLTKLEAIQAEVRELATNAVKMRDRLARINLTIDELNTLNQRLPGPQLELARLTSLLPDSAYVVQYTQNGQKIRLRGRATDAATLQQALTEEPVFRSVTAPQAITKVGESGVEQFFLDLELRRER